jgi:hypothetical protein
MSRMAVIDSRRRLTSAMSIGNFSRWLHEEHVDNFLRKSGIGRIDHVLSLLTARQVASVFEVSLKNEVVMISFRLI